MDVAAAAASSVGFGPGLGFVRSSARCRCCPVPPPRPSSRLACNRGAPAWRTVAACAAASYPHQHEEGLGLAMAPQRSSPQEVVTSPPISFLGNPIPVREEIARCYELVRRLGRGAVYLGSSRVPPTHPHYLHAAELAREIARLLGGTTWTGAGPGLMDAAIQGALESGRPVGGLKIAKEAGEWTTSNFHPYLPPESYLTCRFFSARKHGLVDAAVRNSPTDKTAVVALPGGIGTLDEVFEIMALVQLERIGSALPVPFLLINYDSYYSKLLDFLNDCKEWGTVAPAEVASLWKVCNGNHEALEYLAQFYNVPAGERNYRISPQLKQQKTSYTMN